MSSLLITDPKRFLTERPIKDCPIIDITHAAFNMRVELTIILEVTGDAADCTFANYTFCGVRLFEQTSKFKTAAGLPPQISEIQTATLLPGRVMQFECNSGRSIAIGFQRLYFQTRIGRPIKDNSGAWQYLDIETASTIDPKAAFDNWPDCAE